ncbi:conjugative transfer signal peptidase TraF [Enterobacter kobei]|uniref:conjugative transfer signal peptidase TraF n=1 Tax=Enterobacter kobei TaxID=208224 RepID=UPI003CE9A8BF
MLPVIALAAVYHQGYRVNISNSYPPGLYRLIRDNISLHTGDMVLFCPPDGPAMQLALSRDYIKPGTCRGGFSPVIKKIMAVAGDHISLDGKIRINGVLMPDYRVLKADSHHRPLPRLDSLTVPPDSVFLLSDHRPADSFDSRYYGAVPVRQIQGRMSLKTIMDEGGCCYVIGSMRNSKIIAAQRMILVRLLQLAELRDRIHGTPRPVAIFLDELKYHLSRPALEGLGAARDKGVHIIMAHQSIADLRDCPADLNGDSVVGAVVENAKFKLVYKLQDPDTADWVSRMSGTILVDDETRSTSTNEVLTEVIDDKRQIRQAERYYIDSNMLLNLPPFVSYVFTTTHLPRASMISPVLVSKKPLEVFSVPQESTTRKGPIDFDDDDDADTDNAV